MFFFEKKNQKTFILFVAVLVHSLALAALRPDSVVAQPSSATRQTTLKPSHIARVTIDPDRYPELIADLDGLLLPLGAAKVDEPHPISAILHRNVLFVY